MPEPMNHTDSEYKSIAEPEDHFRFFFFYANIAEEISCSGLQAFRQTRRTGVIRVTGISGDIR